MNSEQAAALADALVSEVFESQSDVRLMVEEFKRGKAERLTQKQTCANLRRRRVEWLARFLESK